MLRAEDPWSCLPPVDGTLNAQSRVTGYAMCHAGMALACDNHLMVKEEREEGQSTELCSGQGGHYCLRHGGWPFSTGVQEMAYEEPSSRVQGAPSWTPRRTEVLWGHRPSEREGK